MDPCETLILGPFSEYLDCMKKYSAFNTDSMWKIPKQATRQTSHFLKNEETRKALQSLREPGTQGWNTIQSLSEQDRPEKIFLFKISETLPVDIPEGILLLCKKWWPHQDITEYLVELSQSIYIPNGMLLRNQGGNLHPPCTKEWWWEDQGLRFQSHSSLSFHKNGFRLTKWKQTDAC